MGKRRRGFGAVYHRPDGRWEGQIRIPGGGRRSVYARTRADVIQCLGEVRWALGQGLPVSSGAAPLNAFFDRWLVVVRPRLRPTTIKAYGISLGRLRPYLGRIPLRTLTPGMIESTYGSLMRSGLSDRTVEQVHAVLHRALDQAMHWGLTRRNPAELATPPRPRTREMTALTKQQLRRLLEFAADSRWHAMWAVLGTSGLRLGEALGLRWDDVDIDGCRLVVRRALQRQPGVGLVFVPPKTEKSRRTVYFPAITCEALIEHRTREHRRRIQAKRWVASNLVFTSLCGGPLEPSQVNAVLHRSLKRAGLPSVRVHDLRHTTASILLEAGTHPKIVQDLLGHSTIRLTLDTYSHLTPPLHRQAAQTMDLIFSNGASIPIAGST